MTPPEHIIVIGAGAAGLIAARELGRAGKKVTLLEARDRCGGRIHPLPTAQFGYPAEGGAEFVHGEAPATHALLREAGLSVLPVQGARWSVDEGAFSRDEMPDAHAARFYECVSKLKDDVTVTDFLNRHFSGPEHVRLRRLVTRMVEGYDAADPTRASMLAVREEWTNSNRSMQSRIVGGYGALIDFLRADCCKQGATIHLHAAVGEIETIDGQSIVRCSNGETHFADAAILTVPVPVLKDITFPPPVREQAAAAEEIGFGNVIKVLLRFKTRWWTAGGRGDLSDLLFLLSDETIPVWWTQRPTEHAVLTGWVAGPRTEAMAQLDEKQLIETGIASLAGIFGLSPKQLAQDLVAGRAIDWARDRFAGGAYSFATPATRKAQLRLASSAGGAIFFSGEALYRGRDMGTVEAALSSGIATARSILARE